MIWVKKTEEEYGNYVDANNTHYVLDWCHKLITPDGSTEEENGYEQYKSIEEACEVWGLTPYIDPEAAMEMPIIEEKENN